MVILVEASDNKIQFYRNKILIKSHTSGKVNEKIMNVYDRCVLPAQCDHQGAALDRFRFV